MKRMRVRDGEPPLRYLLEPKYNKIGRMKNKLASIGKTIMGFFQAWRKESKPVVSGPDQNNEDDGSMAQQNMAEPQVNNKGSRVLEKAVKKQATRLIKYCDISSSEDQQDIPKFPKEEAVKAQPPQINHKKAEVLFQENEKIAQNNIKQVNKVAKPNEPIDKNQPKQVFMRPQIILPKQMTVDDKEQIEGKKRPRHQVPTEQKINSIEQCQVNTLEEQRGNTQRKRIQKIGQGYVSYAQKFSNQKMKIFQKMRKSVLQDVDKYQEFIKREHQNKELSSDSDDESDKKKEQIALRNQVQSFKSLLDILKQRNVTNNVKSSQFAVVNNPIQVKKVKIDIEKFKTVAKQMHQEVVVVQAATPIFTAKQPTPFSNINFTTENKTGSKSSLFFSPVFGGNDRQNKPLIMVTPNQTPKDNKSESEPKKYLLFNFAGNSKKQQSVSNQPEKPAQKISLFGNINKKPEQEPKSNSEVANESKKQGSQISHIIQSKKQQSIKKDQPVKNDVLEKKEEENKQVEKKPVSLSPTKIDNPFLKKPEPNRNILPQLMGIINSNQSNVFSDPNKSKTQLFSIFQQKTSSSPFNLLPTESKPSQNDKLAAKQKQKEPENASIFSTPTKNLFEKYPEMQKAKNLPSEIQQQQSSMFDQSDHDKSFSNADQQKQLASHSIFGSVNPMQNNIGIDVQKQSFLNTLIPGVDGRKSLQIFSKSMNNEPNSLFAQNSSEKKKDSKSSQNNKKKQKQQRAYG